MELVHNSQHGVGLKLAVFLSDYFEISSERDGKKVTRYYEDGLFIKEKKEKSDGHGTFVRLRLSDKYLKELDKIKCKHVQKMIEEKTDACPGLITHFKGKTKDGKKIKEKYSGLTITELMKKYMKPTSKTWEYEFESSDGVTTAKIAFGYDSKATEGSNLMGWTNFIYNKDGGTHVDAISDSLFDVFKKYMTNNFFSEKEKKNLQVRREDVKLGLCGVVVLLTPTPEFLGQYKEKMISEPIREEMCKFLCKKLNKLPETDMQTISKIIRDNIKARLSSQKARQQVKKVGNGLSKDSIDKLIPVRMGCTTKYNELYLVEGLSAGTMVEQARYDFQAIYMLRG
jgi:DNA gyrase subunit B